MARVGFIADENQTKFLDCPSFDIILNWCRQSGKTTSAAVRISHCLTYKPNGLVLIVSATQRQAAIVQRRVTNTLRTASGADMDWRTIKTVELPEDPLNPNSRIVKCSVMSLELANGAECVSVPANEDTVRGYSPNDIYIDEASRVPDAVYDAIRPMRAAKRVRLTLMSTPAGRRGFFHRVWEEGGDSWWKSAVSAENCPRISQKFLEQERREMSNEDIFQQEYYLKFINPEGSLFSAEDVEDMIDNRFRALEVPDIHGGNDWGHMVADVGTAIE